MLSGSIQAVTFDVGGTLIEPWPSVGHVYAAVAGEFGVKCHPEELTSGFVQAWRARGQFDYSQAAWFALVRETFGARARHLPPEFFPRVYQRFVAREVWRVFDDVIPTLERLHARGIRLALVSNWDERLQPMLEGLGLSSYFEVVVSSHEAGAIKPDPEIFDMAARRLGVHPGRILHVGDSLREDFFGATSAGLAAVLIDRDATADEAAGRIATLERLVVGADGLPN
jgi:putative hydrolase of the HAD superfamily